MLTIRFDEATPFVSGVPGQLPWLRISVLPRGATDAVVIGGPPPGTRFSFLQEYPRLHLNGLRAPQILPSDDLRFGDSPESIYHHAIAWLVPVTREFLSAVERGRANDVRVDFTCQLGYWRTPAEHGSNFEVAQATIQRTISQVEWLRILDSLGYGGGWTIEIQQPALAGLDDAIKSVEAAWAKLSGHDAVGAMSDLRKAWDQADSVLDRDSQRRDAAINGLSKGQPNRPSKAERVTEVRRAIDSFTQIGPHSDRYEVTADDALLAYRVSVSVLAYLSKKSRDGAARNP